MFVLLIAGVGIILVGGWRLHAWIRRGERVCPWWLSVTRACTDALAWTSGGVVLLLVAANQPDSRSWVVALICICGGAVIVTRSVSLLLRGIRTAGDVTLGAFIVRRTRSAVSAAEAAIRDGVRIIAPTGLREIRIGFGPLERLLEPGSIVRGYFLGLIFLPVLVALSFAWAMNSGSTSQRTVVGAYIGYNALSIVSCLTAALVLTIVVMGILTYSGMLRIRLNVRGAFRAIAVWTGYGTAAGVVTAALLPLMSRLMPGPYGGESNDAVSLTPQLLIDVPAAFAVIGYVVGIVFAVLALCSSAEFLVLRRGVAPAAFFAAVVGLVQLGLGPGGILRAMVAAMPDLGVEGCSDSALSEHSDSPAWILTAMDACGDSEIYIPDQAFLWCIGILIGALAFGGFVADFRREARSLAAARVSSWAE